MSPAAEHTVFHPGAYLRELLLWQSISPEDFADMTGIPPADMIGITEARRTITSGISEKLAAHFGNASRFWLELQDVYDRTNPDAAEPSESVTETVVHVSHRE